MAEFGDLLRQARDFKSVTLREAERATRIRRSYLEALEAEEFSQLPPAAYARGIVRNYAQYLGLDPASTLSAYERASGVVAEPFEIVPATRPIDAHSHWVPNFAIIAFMIVMSAVVFAWMYSAYFQREESLATSTVGVATVTPLSPSLLAVTSPQVTVATQGGGFATTTPSPSMATPTAAPTQTPTVDPNIAAAPTETALVAAPVVAEVTEEAGAAPTDEVPSDPVGVAHTFIVWVTDEVWVQVTLDGEVVHNDVVPAGAELSFEGDSVAITSGNAAFVYVYVDGEDHGLLGDTWDATFTYP
jgi:cytoskeletal protein RodZ